jgi:tetratricopeptide (TPR) repeat protein
MGCTACISHQFAGIALNSRSLLIGFLIVVAAAVSGAVAFSAIPEFRAYAKRLAFVTADAVGIRSPEEQYAAAYQRLGLPHLSTELLASSQISDGLARLAREPCDKRAIFAFSEALLGAHQDRLAAESYSAFAAHCPNGEGEQNRAAQILFDLGDNEKVIAMLDPLIVRNPTVAYYHYLRGKALANMQRYDQAADDYKSTIELTRNPRDVGEWVFVELANIYAANGRPCDAASAIMAFVAIDPAGRNTAKARKMIEVYTAKGCGRKIVPMEIRKL